MKPFAIPADWTPDQALAVIDLLDELRCHIWQRYEIALLQTYRAHFAIDGEANRNANEPPFVDDPIDF